MTRPASSTIRSRATALWLGFTMLMAGALVVQGNVGSAGAEIPNIGAADTGWEATSVVQAGRGIGANHGIAVVLDARGGLLAWDGCLSYRGTWGVDTAGGVWINPVASSRCASIDAISNAFGKAMENPRVSYEGLDRLVIRNSRTTIVFHNAQNLIPPPPAKPTLPIATWTGHDYGRLTPTYQNSATSRTLRVVSATLPAIGQAAGLLAVAQPNRPTPSFSHYFTLYTDGVGLTSGVCGVVSFRWTPTDPAKPLFNVVRAQPTRLCPSWAIAADVDLTTLLDGAVPLGLDGTTGSITYGNAKGSFVLQP